MKSKILTDFQICISVLLKETRDSFKKWPLNPWWISNNTIVQIRNVTKAATFKSSLHHSDKSSYFSCDSGAF